MRKLFILFALVMIFNVVAQEEIDYNDPEYVNSLSPQEIADAISKGDISNIAIVDDNKLSQALSSDLSISDDLPNFDLSRAVNQDLSLMDNKEVFDEFDSRARQDSFILNDNPKIKERWFKEYGITDEGAEIQSYDGNIVKTWGPEATTFNINDHPGARVLETGRLVLPNKVEISSGTVTKKQDGSINVDGGFVDLSNSQHADVHVTEGTVRIGNNIYSSSTNKPIDINVEGATNTISGDSVIEMNIISNKITSEFTGTVTNYADGHKKFGVKTEYTVYEDGIKSRTYTVDLDTLYYNEQGKCAGSASCIEDYSNPDDKLMNLYKKLDEESKKQGFDLNQFISEEIDNFKVDNFVPNSEFDLYLDLVVLQSAKEHDIDLNEYIGQAMESLNEEYADYEAMIESPSYRFYHNLQTNMGSEGFDVDEYIKNELRKIQTENFQLRPEHGNDRVYQFLSKLQTESSSSEDFSLQDFLDNNFVRPTRDVMIAASDNNYIRMDTHDTIVANLHVEEINDGSIVEFNDNNIAKITFSKESISYQGNLDELNTDITTSVVGMDGETHDILIKGSKIVQCTDCKDCGDYLSQASKVIKNYKKIDWKELKEIKKQLQEKWGARPRDYSFVFNEEAEQDLISMIFLATERASKNKFGVTVTPEEVATTFFMEGGILLFTEQQEEYEIPVPPGVKEVEYRGRKYQVLEDDDDGERYILVDGRFTYYYIDIPKGTTQVIDGGITYSVKIDKEGRRYYKKKGKYYYDHNLGVAAPGGVGYLGLNYLDGAEMERLKGLGFIARNVNVADGWGIFFNTLEEGIQAQAGVYAEKKTRFIEDYKELESQEKMDKPFNELTDEEIYYWSTVYFNAGSPREKLISQRGNMEKWESEEPPDGVSVNYKFNAALRTATYEYLKAAGLFDP